MRQAEDIRGHLLHRYSERFTYHGGNLKTFDV